MSINAYVSKTYAPKGVRPLIQSNSEVAKRAYAVSAISPAGDLFHLVQEKPFDTAAIIVFLCQIVHKVAKKIIVVWDNASIHISEEMKGFLATNPIAQRIHLANFPTYCPELNPDEQVWNRVKTHDLRNSCYRNVKELAKQLDKNLSKLANMPGLVAQFFKHPEVGFYA